MIGRFGGGRAGAGQHDAPRRRREVAEGAVLDKPWRRQAERSSATAFLAASNSSKNGHGRPRFSQSGASKAPYPTTGGRGCPGSIRGAGTGRRGRAGSSEWRARAAEAKRRVKERECSAPCRARAVADGTARHSGVRRSARQASLNRHVRRPGVAVAKRSARPAQAARVRAPTPSAAPRASLARAARKGTNAQLLPPSAVVTTVQCEAASVFVGAMTTTMRRVHAASTQRPRARATCPRRTGRGRTSSARRR